MEYKFEIICIDSSAKIKAKSVKGLNNLLLSNDELWTDSILERKIIFEKDKSLKCQSKEISSEGIGQQKKYSITLRGKYERVEPSRLILLDFLSIQGFDIIYVIKDDISRDIACNLYPLINELETSLRGFLIKFFITKIGSKWWEETADNVMNEKAKKRKNNEKEFSKYIDNKIYLIDFGELGKMVYSLSSGYINKKDILDKVLKMEETVEAIQKLKNELQSNYTKFFKKTFKDNQFQDKWVSIEKLRHKVAHNNLFIQKDLEDGKRYSNELKKIIENAKNEIEKIELTDIEKENIKKVVVAILGAVVAVGILSNLQGE